MLAMVLQEIGGPLMPEERPDPIPGPGEVRIRVGSSVGSPPGSGSRRGASPGSSVAGIPSWKTGTSA